MKNQNQIPKKNISGYNNFSELFYSIRVSSKMSLNIVFIGTYTKSKKDFVVDEKIEMYIIRSYS